MMNRLIGDWPDALASDLLLLVFPARTIFCLPKCRGSSPVERGPEKAGVGSSTLPPGTIARSNSRTLRNCRASGVDVLRKWGQFARDTQASLKKCEGAVNISSLVPNPDDFSRLTKEELGLSLLKVIDSLPESLRHRYNYLNQPGTLDGYSVSNLAPIKEALNEAWVWLQSQNFIAPRPEDANSGFIYVTREGRAYLEGMQVGENKIESSLMSPPPRDEGLIPESKFSLGDRFLYFPPWARAALASRCAARVMPLFVPDQDRKGEEARRDVVSLDASWKLAGLASQGRYLTEEIVSATVAAVESARNSVKEKRSPEYEAVTIAAQAVRSADSAQAIEASLLMDIVTRHELAFSRLAGSTGLGPKLRSAASVSLNTDISNLESQIAAKQPTSEEKVLTLFRKPLWRGLLESGVLSPMIDPWHTRLLELDFLDLYNRYMPSLLSPVSINWNLAVSEINDWASGIRSGAGGKSLRRDAAHSVDAFLSIPISDKRPSLGMLADTALDNDTGDRLGFKPFAEALAGLIDSPLTSTPLVLSINAPWGAGKSTLARMIERILTRKPSASGIKPHVTCWFNAWMHDDAPNLASAFAAEIAQTADHTRSWWRRFVKPLPSTLAPASKREWVLYFFFVADFLLLFLCVAEFLSPVPLWFKAVLGVTALTPLAWAHELQTLAPVAEAVAKFVSDPKAAATNASMNEVSKELFQLIKEATPNNSRFIIFVDDLERCQPPRAVDVLEVVNQLLGHERVVTIVMGDMPAVAACAEIKYKDLAERYSPSGEPKVDTLGLSYGRAYLQKIIQLQFDLPAQTTETMRALMQDLVEPSPKSVPPKSESRKFVDVLNLEGTRAAIDKEIDARMTSGRKDFTIVEREVRDSIRATLSPGLIEDLVRERVQRRLSDDSEVLKEAQAEVMKYVEPFPRHAKRILNRLRLLIFIAHERRMFGGEPPLSARHIGKWAVLCERWPELAQSLSARPELMTRLEQEAQYEAAINSAAVAYAKDATLREFCLSSSSLKFASLMNRIVHFAPAADTPPD
jgi:KAP-like P-loop domain-containing protein